MDAGPIAFVRDGDTSASTSPRRLDLVVDAEELADGADGLTPLEPKYTRGVLGKYRKLVGSASKGAVCG